VIAGRGPATALPDRRDLATVDTTTAAAAPAARYVPDPTSQFDLFGPATVEPDPVAPAPHNPDLAALADRLPRGLRFGTSSWAFPGWAGSVYERRVGEPLLAREGLGAYAKHPLLRAVGMDRTYYAPLTADEYRAYAAAVPTDFRFVVKAWNLVTTPIEQLLRRTPIAPQVDHFLDPAFTIDRIIAPVVEGLGDRLGALLFQFPPLGYTARQLYAFPEVIGRFLEQLPRGPQYSVELRNREVLVDRYADALARNGVTHCFNVHPRMPPVSEQAAMLGERAWLSGGVVCRWMLHPLQDYEAARERYFPFDRLVDPDPKNRVDVAEVVESVLAAGNDMMVIANNKSEGSAPLTLFTLARELDRRGKLRPPGPPVSA
jgi:uncharacterized protein YecE (DUF72 family)